MAWMSFTEVCGASEIQETTCPPELCQVPESHVVYSTDALGLLIKDRQNFLSRSHCIKVCWITSSQFLCQLVNSVKSGFSHGAYQSFLNAFNYTAHWINSFALRLFVLGYLYFKSTPSLRGNRFSFNFQKLLSYVVPKRSCSILLKRMNKKMNNARIILRVWQNQTEED